MKLSMLEIEGNKEQEKKNDTMSIRTRTYYITEIFMHFLGKIDLDGNDKLVIKFYERSKSEDKYMCDKFFHVSCYYVDRRDIDKLGELKNDELELYFLGIIVEACEYISKFNNKEKEIFEIIEKAADNVRKNDFELIIFQKSLSKISSDKKYKASVYRSINIYGEMWYVEVENRNDKSTKKYQIMKQYAHINKTEFFKKSYWDNEKFILTDRFGRIVQTIKI